MVMMQTNGTVVSIRGRFGGTYFKTTAGIIQQQAAPRHVKNTFGGTATPPELRIAKSRLAYINSWTKKTKDWLLLASVLWYFAEVWQNFADANDAKNKRGKKTKPTGYNWWMKFNVKRDAEGLPDYTVPPRSSCTLPQYTIVGEWIKQQEGGTINLYKADGLVHGFPYYFRDTDLKIKTTYTVWTDRTYSYISPGPSLSGEWRWWKKLGTDPVGIYDPNPAHPELKSARVNY
jgi:hypothetical protein